MAILTCEHLTLGYEGRAVLSDVSFTVNAGDYLCVVGENGSGKTTLMKTLLGLQKPLAGSVTYGPGAGGMGYLPQQSAVRRDFPATVGEIVLSGCQARLGRRPFYSGADRALAARNMVRMGVDGLRRRCFRELSGGQQQRALLARALCAADRLLLLDEPVSGLDPKATAELYALVEALNRQEGMAVVMISHDTGAAIRYASHILHIGDSVFFGTKEDYLETPAGMQFMETVEETEED